MKNFNEIPKKTLTGACVMAVIGYLGISDDAISRLNEKDYDELQARVSAIVPKDACKHGNDYIKSYQKEVAQKVSLSARTLLDISSREAVQFKCDEQEQPYISVKFSHNRDFQTNSIPHKGLTSKEKVLRKIGFFMPVTKYLADVPLGPFDGHDDNDGDNDSFDNL